MDYYLDIHLLDDPEFPPNVLMNALFAKLHRVFVEIDNNAIGISFPKSDNKIPTLGKLLRLHGNSANLEKLMAINWLTGMKDHTSVTEINPVPDNCQHREIRRKQAKSNPERLRRRLIKRKGISKEQALLAIPDSAAKQLKLPFISIKSASTEQQFRLFIEHKEPLNNAVKGTFNRYGLSSTATTPWF